MTTSSAPLTVAIGDLVERPYDPCDGHAPAYRVIADHIRTLSLAIGDGVSFAPTGGTTAAIAAVKRENHLIDRHCIVSITPRRAGVG